MKTINIQNVKIKELVISYIKGEYVINVVYALLDESDQEWNIKRTTIKSFTSGQTDKIEKVFQLISTKLKIAEVI